MAEVGAEVVAEVGVETAASRLSDDEHVEPVFVVHKVPVGRVEPAAVGTFVRTEDSKVAGTD